MFNEDEAGSRLWRRYAQSDLLATAIRTGLSVAGPVGAIVGEFITEFVPARRVDRLHDWIEKLDDRLKGVEEEFKQRLASSNDFAALAEQAAVSAVRTGSSDHRADLAHLLKHGLSKSNAEMIGEQALMSLRDRLNDAQVIILMAYGNFKQTFGDAEFGAFSKAHPGLFSVSPPMFGSSPDEGRRWTMVNHYESELATLGLLHDTQGVVKPGPDRQYAITSLGILLLQAIGRYRDP
jgi:hypothetical protein